MAKQIVAILLAWADCSCGVVFFLAHTDETIRPLIGSVCKVNTVGRYPVSTSLLLDVA